MQPEPTLEGRFAVVPLVPPLLQGTSGPRAEMERITRVWQERMRLTYWEITFDWSTPLDPEETLGEIIRNNPYDDAKIRFAANFAEWDRRFANVVIVHELMHLLTRDLEEAAESAGALLGASAGKLFQARLDYELEGVVDRTAAVLVDVGGVV
jgi:hypothetical protein